MLPPELVELIIYHAWGCLSTSSHRHAYSMAQWMLVGHDWLQIVLSVVFRDLWITSYAHIDYITDICCYNNHQSFICELAGIPDVRRYLAQTCRSLTISVYQSLEKYTSQCKELVEYATIDPHRPQLLPGVARYSAQQHAIESIANLIWDFTPHITALHFVLVDCAATYGGWNTFASMLSRSYSGENYPLSLIELHVTFAYTSPPPVLLLDAPRGTFFPPPSRWDMPWQCRFDGVRRLVVRDANADFVAFLTTVCPWLERVESTAEFRAENVPQTVPADVRARLAFVRLPRTAVWGLRDGSDTVPWLEPTARGRSIQDVPVRTRRISIWRLLKHVFRKHK
ncbi:hypothetical protein B0H17DRAFT_1337863 [Mycena rosella]|uniref:Uncharacterized protein n=1 Tax=Mycena rosella TaxID=1033263 RepID=A0AAD7CPY8_MYCRO|nr:hypothetical protein B0H17DRAFT_1337863 [Mycena rosella]